MKKVFATFGLGKHQEYLELAVPGFRKFAAQNNYDFLIPSMAEYNGSEPPSWKKLFLFRDLFSYYDFILWVDADVIIKKFDDDQASDRCKPGNSGR